MSPATAARASTAQTDGLAVLAAARSLPLHGIGGMQVLAWDVLSGLARRGHRVTVLTTSIPGRTAAPFEHEGVVVVPLAGTTPERYSGGWWAASRRYAERRVAGRVDAVLSVSSAAAGLLPLRRSALAVPFVFQAHGTSWNEALAKWRSGRPLDWIKSARNVYGLAKDSIVYRGFDEIVVVSAALGRQFDEAPLRWMTHGIVRTTIANGVDTGHFRFDARARAEVRAHFGFAPRDRVAVFAARLKAQKGAAEALRAVAALRATDDAWKMLIVGDGPEAVPLRRLARDLDCADAVGFAGAVRRNDVAPLLAAGDVFVFPAIGIREGLCLNVLEALSVGLPCVCSESLRPTFEALPSVSYAPADDAEALAAALDHVALRSPPAASLLPKTYSLHRCIDDYEALLRRRVGA
jgi:glycosyltransferase involved in cell wall biosynthesis